MKCQTVVKRLSSVMDGQIRGSELRELRQHLGECAACTERWQEVRHLRQSLRSLPRRTAPVELTSVLRVVASRERVLHRRRASIQGVVGHWLGLFRVWSGNLMRPIALPAAGGLVSAVFLFAMIAPMYTGFANSHPNDVPTILSTQVTLKLSRISYGAIDQDVVVDVLVNDRGRMVDYSVPGGQVWQYDATIRRCVENILLCTEFTPATMFGLPTAGRIRISVRSNQVNVQG